MSAHQRPAEFGEALPEESKATVGGPGSRAASVELTHVHAEEHYAVVMDRRLFLVEVECDGRAWLTNDRELFDPSPEDEERAINEVLRFREGRGRLVPEHLSCGCGRPPFGGAA
jgi:hypothetical protein